jgi:hypothetical protein
LLRCLVARGHNVAKQGHGVAFAEIRGQRVEAGKIDVSHSDICERLARFRISIAHLRCA